jgi:hypothetical protein
VPRGALAFDHGWMPVTAVPAGQSGLVVLAHSPSLIHAENSRRSFSGAGAAWHRRIDSVNPSSDFTGIA